MPPNNKAFIQPPLRAIWLIGAMSAYFLRFEMAYAGCPRSHRFCETWERNLSHRVRQRCRSHHQDFSIVDAHRPCVTIAIPTKAAPRPLLRRVYQAALDRIAMQVTKFLHPLT